MQCNSIVFICIVLAAANGLCLTNTQRKVILVRKSNISVPAKNRIANYVCSQREGRKTRTLEQETVRTGLPIIMDSVRIPQVYRLRSYLMNGDSDKSFTYIVLFLNVRAGVGK